MAKPDISIHEYREGTKQLAASVGPKAEICTSVSNYGPAYRATLYANGLVGTKSDLSFSVHGETFAEALLALSMKWAEHSAIHEQRIVRKMALAIIRITADLGECTDAALRNCGEFDPGQVKRYGAAACEDANTIAGKGPFSIIAAGRANAEAA